MGDSEVLIDRLRRANRRWKTLALAACSALILTVLFGVVAVARQQYQVAAERRRAMEAMAAAYRAANAGQAK